MASPWQLTPGDAPTCAQLAGLIAAAAETLHRLVGGGAFSPGETAKVASRLQTALDHISGTLSAAADTGHPGSAPSQTAQATPVTAHTLEAALGAAGQVPLGTLEATAGPRDSGAGVNSVAAGFPYPWRPAAPITGAATRNPGGPRQGRDDSPRPPRRGQ